MPHGIVRMMTVFLAAVAAPRADTLFSDDFGDGDADGWFEISQIEYQVEEGMYWFHGGYEENQGISYSGDSAGFMSVPDYSARCRMIIDTGYFIGLFVRFREDAPYNLMLLLCPPEQKLMLYSWHWTGVTLLDWEPYPVEYDEEHWMRFEVQGAEFRGKAWQGGTGDEPTFWMVSAFDSTVSLPGSVGLFCVGLQGGDVSLSGRFDDVCVTDPAPTLLESSTWGSIKSVAAP